MVDQADRKPSFSLQDPLENLEGFGFDRPWMQLYAQATIGVRTAA